MRGFTNLEPDAITMICLLKIVHLFDSIIVISSEKTEC